MKKMKDQLKSISKKKWCALAVIVICVFGMIYALNNKQASLDNTSTAYVNLSKEEVKNKIKEDVEEKKEEETKQQEEVVKEPDENETEEIQEEVEQEPVQEEMPVVQPESTPVVEEKTYAYADLNVPYINQYEAGAPMGCEGASLLEAFHYKGYALNYNLKAFLTEMPISPDDNPYHGFVESPWVYSQREVFQSIFPSALISWGGITETLKI